MIGAIHVYAISTLGEASVTPEGRTVRTAPTVVEVRGSVDELSARDVEIAAQAGQTHDIACRAELGTAVTDRDQVVVTEPARLAGTYSVDTIRTLRTHLRLLCSRTTLED